MNKKEEKNKLEKNIVPLDIKSDNPKPVMLPEQKENISSPEMKESPGIPLITQKTQITPEDKIYLLSKLSKGFNPDEKLGN
jgi:hypothetical protein